MKIFKFLFLSFAIFAISGCMSVNVNMFVDKSDPLQEITLSGSDSSEKILLLPIDGIISDYPGFKLLGESTNMVEETVAQLTKASRDPSVKAVILKVDSPGGATTASDMIYNEIVTFKKRNNVKVYAMMMDIAASGAYMISLPADKIIAQPTTVTGSVGVVFIRPKLDGLLNMIGVEIKVNKSGEHKDMGSPFRKDSEEEDALFNDIVNKLNNHFYSLIERHRKIDGDNLKKIKTAKIFLAEEALHTGLIDAILYPNECVEFCKQDAGLSPDAKLIVYRRKRYPHDNIYNRSQMKSPSEKVSLVNLGYLETAASLKPGFYYLCPLFSGF